MDETICSVRGTKKVGDWKKQVHSRETREREERSKVRPQEQKERCVSKSRVGFRGGFLCMVQQLWQQRCVGPLQEQDSRSSIVGSIDLVVGGIHALHKQFIASVSEAGVQNSSGSKTRHRCRLGTNTDHGDRGRTQKRSGAFDGAAGEGMVQHQDAGGDTRSRNMHFCASSSRGVELQLWDMWAKNMHLVRGERCLQEVLGTCGTVSYTHLTLPTIYSV